MIEFKLKELVQEFILPFAGTFGDGQCCQQKYIVVVHSELVHLQFISIAFSKRSTNILKKHSCILPFFQKTTDDFVFGFAPSLEKERQQKKRKI